MRDETDAIVLAKILELLDSNGSEPEYLEIRTPIKEDPQGWFAVIQWMHHDGNIVDSEAFRHSSFSGLLDKVLDYLTKIKE